MSKRFFAPGLALVLAGWSFTISPAHLAAQTGSIGLNFTGVTVGQGMALNANSGYAPPDNDGAVGTTEIVQLINGAFAVYDKATGASLQAPISGRQFWINAGIDPGTDISNLGAFNARIVFDPTTNRWIAAELSAQPTNNMVMIARSDTADALGGWQAVSFSGNVGGEGAFADYTRLGVDANGVYIATNNYTENSPDGGLVSMSLFSLPKADLLAATPSLDNLTRFDGFGYEYGWSMQPIVDFGPAKSNAPLLAVAPQFSSSSLFLADLTGTAGPGATLTSDMASTIAVAPYNFPPAAAQPDGTRSVGTIDDRIYATVVQVGHFIYAVRGTQVGANAAISWDKIDEQTNLVVQEGVLSNPDFDYFQPSIAVNANGDIVIGFTRSGFGTGGNLSDFAVVGKTVGGMVTFGTPFLLQASAVDNYHYFNGRWGDYSTTVVDPSNPNVFWTFQEYATGSNAWATQITQIIVPEPSSLALAALGLVALSWAAWRRRRARTN